ncbi:MAG: alpha/beta hydrolase, partial [Acidobacteriota bacterium]|nr:alpha/beta hydrolase [Acidobacteriota bacterium]
LDHLPPAPTPNLYPPALARGRVVVVANLRLSTEAQWPASIHDAKCAMRWVRKHAEELRIDAQRIAAFGASASANISALLALTASTGKLDDPDCDPSVSTDVKAVGCLSGIFDWDYYKNVDSGDKSLFVNVLPPFLGRGDKLYREASPSTYVHTGAPPFLLTHGLQDLRVPYSQMTHFAELLKRATVTVETHSINNYQHGAIPGKEPDPGYAVTDQRIYTFFDRYLNGKRI